jgi:hypothetical protein
MVLTAEQVVVDPGLVRLAGVEGSVPGLSSPVAASLMVI